MSDGYGGHSSRPKPNKNAKSDSVLKSRGDSATGDETQMGNQLEDTVDETLKYRTPIGFSKSSRVQREKIEKSATTYAICASIKRTLINNETAKGRKDQVLAGQAEDQPKMASVLQNIETRNLDAIMAKLSFVPACYAS